MGSCKKTDLNHGAIALCEAFVKSLDLLCSILLVTFDLQSIYHVLRLLVSNALKDVYWDLNDLLRVLLCQILNASSTFKQPV